MRQAFKSILLLFLGTEIGVALSADSLDKHYRMLYGKGQSDIIQLHQKRQREQQQSLVANPIALKYMTAAHKRSALSLSPLTPKEVNSTKRVHLHVDSSVENIGVPGERADAFKVLSLQVHSQRRDGKKVGVGGYIKITMLIMIY